MMTETGQSEQQCPLWRRFGRYLLHDAEGHIFLMGLFGLSIYAGGLLALALLAPERLHIYLSITAAHITFGRAAGMSFGYAANLSNVTVITLAFIIEALTVLIFYPLFVFSWRYATALPFLKTPMERLHEAAVTHRDVIHRYGLIGLFVFVWLPFWMTGSVIGCVIGGLLEMRPWMTVGVVLGGAYAAIISWTLILRKLHYHLSGFGAYTTPLVVVAFAIILGVVGKIRQRNSRSKHSQACDHEHADE